MKHDKFFNWDCRTHFSVRLKIEVDVPDVWAALCPWNGGLLTRLVGITPIRPSAYLRIYEDFNSRILLNSAWKIVAKHVKHRTNSTSVLHVTITMIVISFLSCLCTSPLIIKHIKGVKKLFIGLQQISAFIYLVIVALNYGVVTDSTMAIGSQPIIVKAFSREIDYDRSRTFLLWKSTLLFMANFFYFGCYIIGFMQSLDVYQMICFPFEYKDFCETRNIIKCFLIGCCFSLLAAVDHGIAVLVALAYKIGSESDPYSIALQWKSHGNILWGLHIFATLKQALIKTVLLAANSMFVIAVRRCLNESVTTSGRQKRLYDRLYKFSILPVCLNLIFSVHEALSITYSFTYDDGYETFLSEGVIMSISVVVLTIQSLSYLAAYFYLFPGLGKAMMCSKQHWVQ